MAEIILENGNICQRIHFVQVQEEKNMVLTTTQGYSSTANRLLESPLAEAPGTGKPIHDCPKGSP